MEPSAASFDAVPAGAVILWEHSTFRGQFFAAHMCEGEEDDPVRWPALLGLCVEVARLLVPGVTVKHAKDALEKKITQQARAITNSHMRNHEPAKVAKNPNFAKLADVEAATSKWEQSQRSLYLRHLEREQRPAGSSAPAGRVAFPSQLVHDLNELRRSAAASRATSSEGTAPVAARPVDSRITPDGGGSMGSSEQQRRVSQGPFPAVLPAAAALADAGLAPAEGGGDADAGAEVDDDLEQYLQTAQQEPSPRRSPRNRSTAPQPQQQQGQQQQEQQGQDQQEQEELQEHPMPFAHAADAAGFSATSSSRGSATAAAVTASAPAAGSAAGSSSGSAAAAAAAAVDAVAAVGGGAGDGAGGAATAAAAAAAGAAAMFVSIVTLWNSNELLSAAMPPPSDAALA